jgi:hypothetical protein
VTAAPDAGAARWWLIDLEQEQIPGHYLICGRGRRQALAEFRAGMVVFYSAHDSKRWAAERVRTLGPVVIAGPLTEAEALDHELGWAWAWAITRRESTTIMLEPGGPANRETAERELGLELTGLIERNVTAGYPSRKER